MAFNIANPTLHGCVLSSKTERPLTFTSKPTSRRKQIAATPKAFAHRGIERPFNYGREHTVERVLRYPDGYERRIRYPISDDVPLATLSSHETATTEDYLTDYVSQDEDFDPNTWTTYAIWNSTTTMATADINTAPPLIKHTDTHPLPTQPDPTEKKKNNNIPLSPLALLRLMTSDAYKTEECRIMQDIASSYTILADGCPWPVPRPLYILSVVETDHDDDDVTRRQSPSAYTLRVRLHKTGVEDELTKLLGNKTRPDSSSLIRCSELKDGIITFEDELQAEAFGKLLEEQRQSPETMRLKLAQCDSHALFRLSQEVSSVVVLVDRERGVEGLPPPHRLASALRRHDDDENW